MANWGRMVLVFLALGPSLGATALAGQIPQERGFSIYEADAEAGLHPEQPSPGDERVQTTGGHVYWLRPNAISRGGLISVEKYFAQGEAHIQLTVAPDTARRFSAWTMSNIGHQFVYVVNGEIIGEPIVVQDAITSARKLDMLVDGGALGAMAVESLLRQAMSDSGSDAARASSS